MTRVDPYYFPAGKFSRDDNAADAFVQQWYGKHLRSMDEPRLYDSSETATTVYRFLCLATFHSPYTIRVNKTPEQIVLNAKTTNGRGGYGPGKVVVNQCAELMASQWQRLESTIEQIKFWAMPTLVDDRGKDGTQCIVEGYKAGTYHVVDRWQPTGRFKTLCEIFCTLCPPETSIELNSHITNG